MTRGGRVGRGKDARPCVPTGRNVGAHGPVPSSERDAPWLREGRTAVCPYTSADAIRRRYPMTDQPTTPAGELAQDDLHAIRKLRDAFKQHAAKEYARYH